MEKTNNTEKFRLNAKKLFLTWPKAGEEVTRDQMAIGLFDHFKENLEGHVIAQELHKDGTIHYHVCVWLKRKCDVKNCHTLDGIHPEGKHGSYESMRSDRGAVGYTGKDDTERISWGVGTQWLAKMEEVKITDKVYEMVLSGKDNSEIAMASKGWYLMNRKKVHELRQEKIAFENYEIAKQQAGEIKIYGWQGKALERLLAQDRRKVLWVVDGVGFHGKSKFGEYLEFMHGAIRMTQCAGTDSIRDNSYRYNYEDIVVFDYEREEQKDVSYKFIEIIKNNAVVSTKYEPMNKYKGGITKVIVFANWMPNKKAMSEDRWDILEITPGVDFYTPPTFN
ncbi:replication associated protein [Antarctic virus CAA_003_44]|nr:replication associated protein [Antarctic virus CAA_003_44]